MVEKFVETYAKMIASFPEDIVVDIRYENDIYDIDLFANREDLGKLIGKDGKMIGAIKTVISGCKAKNGKNYRINVEPKK
jgi:predicted RNA-binding protein YlqC (UPF0109 family)